MADFKNSVFITSSHIPEMLFDPLTLITPTDYFVEFVAFNSCPTYLTPYTHKNFSKRCEGKNSLSHLTEVFQDGGKLIGADTHLADEFQDIVFLACFANISTNKEVVIVLPKEIAKNFSETDFKDVLEKVSAIHPNVKAVSFGVIDIDGFVSLIRADKEFGSYIASRFTGSY